jgi:LacI family transcriptional regulator
MMARHLKRTGAAAERLVPRLRHLLEERRPGLYEPLPSYKVLSRRFQVSLDTVLNAMALLEAEGLVRRLNGRGTFYCPKPEAPRSADRPRSLKSVTVVVYEPFRGRISHVLNDEYLAGVTEALDAMAIRMRFAAAPDASRFDRVLSPNLPLSEQAALVVHPFGDRAFIEWLHRRHVPCVTLDFLPSPWARDMPPHHRVAANKSGGAAEAARHLLDLGHRRIGFIGAVEEPPPEFSVLYGIHAALVCAGVPLEPSLRLNLPRNFDEEDLLVEPVTAWLKRKSRPTAVLTQTDAIALAALRAARSLGLRVPRDLSVVGFNGLPETETSDPPLTTVLEPQRVLAKAAVQLLVEVAGGRHQEWQSRLLECHLAVRQSTGRPGA